MKEAEERVGSSSSSSSSLPVSYGVDCEKYYFSSSVSSLSQPFSPEGSSNNNSCVLENNLSSVFSLDHTNTIVMFPRDRPCSCLHHVFEWILQRCCGCLC